MPKIKKRYTLVYSKKTHDNATYNVEVYTEYPCSLFDIIATRTTSEVEQAKQRVEITSEGQYRYQPSTEYKQYYKKHKRRRDKNSSQDRRTY